MNKLLQRQIQRHFGNANEVPDNFIRLLNVISESYDHYEKDRKMIERSIELSSREMIELNNEIKKNGKTELEKAHKQLKNLLEDINEVLFSVDMISLNLLQISAACEKIFGYTSEEFFADEDLWKKIVHPDDKDISKQLVQSLFQGKQVLNQYRIIHKDKSIRWIENKIIPIFDDTGLLVRIDGLTTDITERKNAENVIKESKEQYKALVENAPEALVVMDVEKNKFVSVSESAVKLFKMSKEDLLRIGPLEVSPEYQPDGRLSSESAIENIKDAVSGNKPVFEWTHCDVNGTHIPCEVWLVRMPSEKNVIIRGSIIDISERKKAEEALKENEKRLRQIIDLVPHFIFAKDANGKFILTNEAVAEAYGCNVEDLIGKSDSDFNSNKEEVEHFIQEDMEVINSGNAKYNIEEAITDAAGNVRILSTTKIPYTFLGADIPGILGVSVDITDRKKSNKALELAQFTIENTSHAIYWIKSDSNFHMVNNAASQMLGFTFEELMQLNVPGIDPLYDKDVWDGFWKALIEKKFIRLITKHIRKDGTLIDVQIDTHYFKFENLEMSCAFVSDITERKIAETLLRQSEANLEIKNKELELKNKELEQFAYVASHDLQEPLRTTSSFAELLQRQYKGKLDEKADKYLTFINQSSDRMKVLIKDLLDYSRIGRKKDVEQVDGNIILKGVLADLDVAIKETKAEIKFCNLPVFKGYTTEIKQLFQNLIINAIKFRKQDEIPRINICVKKAGHQWEFSCTDNGIGINNEHTERIFVIFQRLHTRNEYEGSGIGLAHCKKIVELHGGKIWVKSNVGEGSTFYFTIPEN